MTGWYDDDESPRDAAAWLSFYDGTTIMGKLVPTLMSKIGTFRSLEFLLL